MDLTVNPPAEPIALDHTFRRERAVLVTLLVLVSLVVVGGVIALEIVEGRDGLLTPWLDPSVLLGLCFPVALLWFVAVRASAWKVRGIKTFAVGPWLGLGLGTVIALGGFTAIYTIAHAADNGCDGGLCALAYVLGPVAGAGVGATAAIVLLSIVAIQGMRNPTAVAPIPSSSRALHGRAWGFLGAWVGVHAGAALLVAGVLRIMPEALPQWLGGTLLGWLQLALVGAGEWYVLSRLVGISQLWLFVTIGFGLVGMLFWPLLGTKVLADHSSWFAWVSVGFSALGAATQWPLLRRFGARSLLWIPAAPLVSIIPNWALPASTLHVPGVGAAAGSFLTGAVLVLILQETHEDATRTERMTG